MKTKVKMKKSNKIKKSELPCLITSNDGEVIFAIDKKGSLISGVVLHSGCSNFIEGTYHTDMIGHLFYKFTGKIKMKNSKRKQQPKFSNCCDFDISQSGLGCNP